MEHGRVKNCVVSQNIVVDHISDDPALVDDMGGKCLVLVVLRRPEAIENWIGHDYIVCFDKKGD